MFPLMLTVLNGDYDRGYYTTPYSELLIKGGNIPTRNRQGVYKIRGKGILLFGDLYWGPPVSQPPLILIRGTPCWGALVPV